jgi:hypothetical protein
MITERQLANNERSRAVVAKQSAVNKDGCLGSTCLESLYPKNDQFCSARTRRLLRSGSLFLWRWDCNGTPGQNHNHTKDALTTNRCFEKSSPHLIEI